MATIEELNVNDTVSIVRKSGLVLTGVITAIRLPFYLDLNDDYSLSVVYVDSIKVLKRAPDPLPTATGYYMALSNTLYRLESGVWYFVGRNGWEVRGAALMQAVRADYGLKYLSLVDTAPEQG